MNVVPLHTDRSSDDERGPLPPPKRTAIDDATLVRRARDGDAWAEEALLRRHSSPTYGLLVRLLGPTEAEDALQDTFILALRDLEKLEDPNAFSGWLKRIAVHRAHRRFRRRRVARLWGVRDDPGLEGLAATDASPETRAELALLDRTLSRLSPELRTIWMLRHVEGFLLEEIAEARSCSLATVKRRLRRAEDRVRASTRRGEP